MKIFLIPILFLASSSMASEHTATANGQSTREQQSVFREVPFRKSTFTEKLQPSSGTLSAASTSFGLKQLHEEARMRTETALSELGAKPEAGRIVVDLPSDILFDFDRAEVRRDARPVLEKVAGVLIDMKDRRVSIIGHTDSKGSEEYNDGLSTRRAESVREWLIENGVTSQMRTEGRGERFPAVPNETAAGLDDPQARQLNRRVQLIIEEE